MAAVFSSLLVAAFYARLSGMGGNGAGAIASNKAPMVEPRLALVVRRSRQS